MISKQEVFYDIKLDFEIGTQNPSRLFSTMAEMIESFKQIDVLLGQSINKSVEIVQTLVLLETGSILARIKEMFEYDDEDNLNREDIELPMETYFDESRDLIIETLKTEKQIDNIETIRQVQEKIHEIAEKERLTKAFDYQPVNPIGLAENMERLGNAPKALEPNERITYNSRRGSVEMPRESIINVPRIKDMLADRTIHTERNMLLKIKKPDYLGSSRWIFKHGSKKIEAKILDEVWLDSFHNRTVKTSPGDALDVSVEITEVYDKSGNVIKEVYEITKVHNVLSNENDNVFLGGRDET